MFLEMVQSHPVREDTYINKVIVPHNDMKEHDKKIIRRILLKELERFEN